MNRLSLVSPLAMTTAHAGGAPPRPPTLNATPMVLGERAWFAVEHIPETTAYESRITNTGTPEMFTEEHVVPTNTQTLRGAFSLP